MKAPGLSPGVCASAVVLFPDARRVFSFLSLAFGIGLRGAGFGFGVALSGVPSLRALPGRAFVAHPCFIRRRG